MANDRDTLPPAPITLESVYQLQVQQSEQIASLLRLVHGLCEDVAKIRGTKPNGHDPLLDWQPPTS